MGLEGPFTVTGRSVRRCKREKRARNRDLQPFVLIVSLWLVPYVVINPMSRDGVEMNDNWLTKTNCVNFRHVVRLILSENNSIGVRKGKGA